MVTWIRDTLLTLQKNGLMTGSRSNDEYIIKKVIENNNLDEEHHGVTTHAIPVDNSMAYCGEIEDVSCLMQAIKKESKPKYEPFEFIDEAQGLAKKVAGTVATIESTHKILLMSAVDPPAGAYSCKRCYFKYRMETLVERMSHALLPVKMVPKRATESQTYHLVGMKKEIKRNRPGQKPKEEPDKVKRMVALGLVLSEAKYLLAMGSKGLHLLELDDYRQETGLSTRGVYMITNAVVKSSKLDEIFMDGTAEITAIEIDSIYVYDKEKECELNIFAENHAEYGKLYKKAYPDDGKFAEIREKVDRKQEPKRAKKKPIVDLTKAEEEKKETEEEKKEKEEEMLSGWMKVGLAGAVLVFVMIVTFQIIKPTGDESYGEPRDVPVF